MKNYCINVEKDGDIVRDEKVLVEIFNENYLNIVEISSGKKPSYLENCEDSAQDDATVDKIISKYSSQIRREFSIDKEFELPYASAQDINQEKNVQMESLLSSLKSRPKLLIVILQI